METGPQYRAQRQGVQGHGWPGPVPPRSRPAPVPSPPVPALRGAGGGSAAPCRSRWRNHVPGRARKGRGITVPAPGPRPCGRRVRPRTAALWAALPALRGAPGAAAGCARPSWTSRCSAAPPGPARRRPPSLRPGRLPQPAAPGPAVSAGERWLGRCSDLRCRGARGSLRLGVPGALGHSRSHFPRCNQHVFLRLSPFKVPQPRSVLL